MYQNRTTSSPTREIAGWQLLWSSTGIEFTMYNGWWGFHSSGIWVVSNSRITGNQKNRSYSALRLNYQLLWDIHHLPPRIQWCRGKNAAINWDIVADVCVCVRAYHRYKYRIHNSWLVVWTPLKNISQLGLLFPIYGNKMFQATNQIQI